MVNFVTRDLSGLYASQNASKNDIFFDTQSQFIINGLELCYVMQWLHAFKTNICIYILNKVHVLIFLKAA